MQPIPFRIQSHNTKFFAVSSPSDKPGQEIDTKPGKDSIPEDSVRAQLSTLAFPGSSSSNVTLIHFGQVLFTSAPIVNAPPSTVQMVEFTGVSGLYVSLKVSLDLTSFHDNWGLTNAGLREIPTKPNLLGPTRNFRG